MDSLKVGLFTDVYFPSPTGISSSVYLLHRELTRAGHKSCVIAPSIPHSMDSEDGVHRVHSVRFPYYDDFRLALPIPWEDAGCFDIVHTHTPLLLGCWGAAVAKSQKVPHISTVHTHYHSYRHYLPGLSLLDRTFNVVSWWARNFYQSCDRIIVPSVSSVPYMRSLRLTGSIEVIPTGIDSQLLDRAPTPACPWPSGSRRLITVSRLGREKNVTTIVRSLFHIRKHVDAHLVIIGSGPERRVIGTTIERMGLSDHVTMIDFVPYELVGGYYRLAELFLFASTTETQGLVLWEAQAAGLPVIAAAGPGVLDAILDNVTGIAVPRASERGMANKVLELLGDEDKRRDFGRAARDLYMTRSAARSAEHVVALYQLVQAEGPR